MADSLVTDLNSLNLREVKLIVWSKAPTINHTVSTTHWCGPRPRVNKTTPDRQDIPSA